MEELICQHPASLVTTGLVSQSFTQWRDRVLQSSSKALRYADGAPVKLDANSKYSLISLKLGEFLTPEQFMTLMGVILGGVEELVKTKALPADVFQGISTITNIETPEIPESFEGDVYLELSGHLALLPQYIEGETNNGGGPPVL
jgi:hypothetical protein